MGVVRLSICNRGSQALSHDKDIDTNLYLQTIEDRCKLNIWFSTGGDGECRRGRYSTLQATSLPIVNKHDFDQATRVKLL